MSSVNVEMDNLSSTSRPVANQGQAPSNSTNSNPTLSSSAPNPTNATQNRTDAPQNATNVYNFYNPQTVHLAPQSERDSYCCGAFVTKHPKTAMAIIVLVICLLFWGFKDTLKAFVPWLGPKIPKPE